MGGFYDESRSSWLVARRSKSAKLEDEKLVLNPRPDPRVNPRQKTAILRAVEVR